MNKNHQLVNEMMKYCGFTEGAGMANNLFIETALESGAYGAKLTGAGEGGSVFAVVKPGKEAIIEDAWKIVIDDHQLQYARILRPNISKQGLVIQRID